jgi:lysozyme family protein
MDRFDICLPFTLRQECPHPEDWSNPANFSNDAHDPGGETMCGIIQREYSAFRIRRGLPSQDVRNISLSEGTQIYRENYWLPHCDSLFITLAPGVDLCLFDANVNMGSHEGTKLLQFCIGADIDGEWGPQTDQMLKDYKAPETLCETYTMRRKTVYREMRGFQYFGRDWIRRADEIGAAAIKMRGT